MPDQITGDEAIKAESEYTAEMLSHGIVAANASKISRIYKNRQLLTFTNERFNDIWNAVKKYRKEKEYRTVGDAVLALVEKGLGD